MTNVTSTLHFVAEVVERAAVLSMARVETKVTTPTTSLRLLNGDVVLLPPVLSNFVRVLRRSRQPGLHLAAREFTTEQLTGEATD